ncbi:EI24 domain-containing protein [Litoreibacter roseus]|uniref:Membrane protein n=1 Tax=Litoreibacter roseus TaxID=2601869 RepID=A0A6N6JAS3_9RHOB|nr:EI24 domain-containing protein [Litoreibacter roseus]GFE63343.1 membrane protein [Litoreibacter roseus]
MFADMLKALGQIGDPRFTKVLAMGIGLTLLLLFAFTVGFAWLAGFLIPDSFVLPWIGEITWIDNVASIAVIPIMLVASVFLMVPVASAFTGLFLDQVADAVEAQHYEGLPPVSGVPFGDALVDTLKFLGLIIAVNLVALVLYLIFAPFAPLIFWAVNGLLLGREYATLVAQRRLGMAGARAFRKKHRTEIWLAGTIMAVPLTIPIVNLTIPILGVAAFTHLFHRLNRSV